MTRLYLLLAYAVRVFICFLFISSIQKIYKEKKSMKINGLIRNSNRKYTNVTRERERERERERKRQMEREWGGCVAREGGQREMRESEREREYQDNQLHLVPYIFDLAETKCYVRC